EEERRKARGVTDRFVAASRCRVERLAPWPSIPIQSRHVARVGREPDQDRATPEALACPLSQARHSGIRCACITNKTAVRPYDTLSRTVEVDRLHTHFVSVGLELNRCNCEARRRNPASQSSARSWSQTVSSGQAYFPPGHGCSDRAHTRRSAQPHRPTHRAPARKTPCPGSGAW